MGADVTATDPEAIPNSQRMHPQLKFAAELGGALQDAEVVVLVTEWNEYRHLLPADVEPFTAGRTIIDGRNALDPVAWRAAGWKYVGLGRP
jgi:UDPglucose 6-dehydrogenase